MWLMTTRAPLTRATTTVTAHVADRTHTPIAAIVPHVVDIQATADPHVAGIAAAVRVAVDPHVAVAAEAAETETVRLVRTK